MTEQEILDAAQARHEERLLSRPQNPATLEQKEAIELKAKNDAIAERIIEAFNAGGIPTRRVF